MKKAVSVIYSMMIFLVLIYVIINKTIPRGINIKDIMVYILIFMLLVNYLISVLTKKELIPKKILSILLGVFILILIISLVSLVFNKFIAEGLLILCFFAPLVFSILKNQIINRDR